MLVYKRHKLLLILLIILLTLSGIVQGQSGDVLTPTLSVNPRGVGVDGQVRVQLTLDADSVICPTTVRNLPLEVVLVLDRSSSMAGDKWTGAQESAKTFIDQMDFDVDQVAVVFFSNSAQLVRPLTQDAENAKQTIDAASTSGGTDIADGISIGGQELLDNGRLRSSQVVILLSDGGSDATSALREADTYKDAGIRIVTIGLGDGVNAGLLKDIASEDGDYHFAPDPSQLDVIYEDIAESIQQGVGITDILARQTFDDVNFELDPGSISSEGTVSGNVITWQLPILADDDLAVLNYRLTAKNPGTFDVTLATEIAYLRCEDEDRLINLDPGPSLTVSPPPPPPIITPEIITGRACEDGCVEEIIRVEIPEFDSAQVVNQLDVAFLFDVSSSMGDELDVVKSESNSIMQNLRTLVDDTNFAVASFADYPGFSDAEVGGPYGDSGDYAWQLDQDLTDQIIFVERALNRVNLLNGGDGPEAYSRALYETQSLNWRPDARRIVILFGDSFPHDRTFFGSSTGTDPGADGVAGTTDDLQLNQVVAELVGNNITVLAVNAGGAGNAERFFRYVAEETEGEYFRVNSADDIPEVIQTLIGGQIASIGQISVQAEAPYSSWLDVTPARHTNITYDGRILEFRVRVCPGETDAERGEYEVDLTLTADREPIETIPVELKYWPVCLPPVDLYVADNLSDDGTECSNLSGETFWESPDIVIRHEADANRENLGLQAGQENYIYALIHNRGTENVGNANVHIFWGRNELQPTQTISWHDLGVVDLAVPGEGEAWTPPLPWTPPDDGSYSFLIRVEANDDPVRANNDVACENNLAMQNILNVSLDTPSLEEGKIGGRTTLFANGEGLHDLMFDISALPPTARFSVTLDPTIQNSWSGEIDGGHIVNNEVVADNENMLVLHDLPLETSSTDAIGLNITSPFEETFPIPIRLRKDEADVTGVTVNTQAEAPVEVLAPPLATPVTDLSAAQYPNPSLMVPIVLLTLLFAGLLFWLLTREEKKN